MGALELLCQGEQRIVLAFAPDELNSHRQTARRRADAPTLTSCRADERSQIIEAIAKRDPVRAERLMLEHLEHIESSMKLGNPTEVVDLKAIFKG